MTTFDQAGATPLLKHRELLTELYAASLFLPVALGIDNLATSYFDELQLDRPNRLASFVELAGSSIQILIIICMLTAGIFALGLSFQTLDRHREAAGKFWFCLVSSIAFAFCVMLVNGCLPHIVQLGLSGSLLCSFSSLLLLDWRDWEEKLSHQLGITAVSIMVSVFLYNLSKDF